ncbi:MAG: M3 family metallopeptidase [Saprospirales bacterium]|nr:M3 family metallopeptidase [Saprospirales bacterium]MBK8489685.1 M3 family metallopeptidase [Saprospirales bacterium]
MRKYILLILPLFTLMIACNPTEETTDQTTNPLVMDWDTPFGTPPFDLIKQEHFIPAFQEAFAAQKAEVDAIINQPDAPTFANTVEALEYSGGLVRKVSNVFFAMTGAMTNDALQEIDKQVSPMLSAHRDDINLNPALFQRVKVVYDQKDQLGLNTEQAQLLKKHYDKFVRGGANLSGADQEAFRKINEELAILSVQFGENVLKETNKFEIVLSTEEELAGLPESVLAMGAEDAKAKGYEGKWVYTIQRPSMYPFLTYSSRRDLREKLYKGYIMKGDNNDELDNKKILSRIASLRVQRANLLGYPTHAHYVLEENMAKTPDRVFELLNKLWTPALNVAKGERADMQKMIDAEGGNFKLESWDWWYYAEQVKKAKYDLNEDELRPYFQVESVIKGVFDLSSDLFGITFEERTDIPKYHPDVKTFEVKDLEGNHVAILYTDYFPRDSKQGGAWMDVFVKQMKQNGEFIHPVIYNVGNFAKPTGDKPALLSLDDVNTLFHEFGHALHGMLSDCTYPSLSGTSTPTDFVEFPSQVMENWCMHPDVLKKYAFHYETGEAIPDALIQKIRNASKFNQGFATVEYLAASYLDMYWHTLTQPEEKDAAAFEKEKLDELGLIPEIVSRYRSTYFNHIFSGGYSAGYYSYIWSEVLDADAFRAFEEAGNVYDQTLARKYKQYILASGGTDDSMELYKKFRGKEPSIEPLLEKRGLN